MIIAGELRLSSENDLVSNPVPLLLLADIKLIIV
jgi:hypothetical protein